MEYEIQLAERTLKTYAVNPKGNALFQPGQEVAVIFTARRCCCSARVTDPKRSVLSHS